MGQFKPMVKMMTTEPSVELKLKKGGMVKKADGGMMGAPAPAGALPPAMPARGGMPGAAAPMKPSLAMRRRAMRGMPAAPGPAAPVGPAASMMKKGGKAEGGESKAEHKAEMTKMAKTAKELKKHESMPASKAHKGLKTGGVVNGQGGFKAGGAAKKMARGGMFGVTPGSRRPMSEIDPQFRANFAGPYEGYTPDYESPDGYKKGGKAKKYAKGGIINTENQGGEYRNTKMDTTKPDHSPAKTGDVKMGNGGGYATGGVAKANAGGYKKGGAAKKAYAAGGVVDSGAPVAMPQGRKKPTAPVSITELSGTFKKGGKVTAAEGRLQKAFTKENATAMKQAKAYSNEVYSKYGKKMKEGGIPAEAKDQIQTARNQRAYENWEKSQREENEGMRDAILGAPKRMMQGLKGLFSPKAPEGSVTKTEKSVTVTPAKKRGGAVC